MPQIFINKIEPVRQSSTLGLPETKAEERERVKAHVNFSFVKLKKPLSLLLILLLITASFVFKPQSAKAVFAPSDISNLQLWLDASQGVTTNGTTAATDGQTVQQWNDQSGHTNNAVQMTGGAKPVFKTGIFNGKSTLRFDGSKNIVTSSFLNSSYDTAFTYFSVRSQADGSLRVVSSNQNPVWFDGKQDGPIFNTQNLSHTQNRFGSGTNTGVGVAAFRYNGSVQRFDFLNPTVVLAPGTQAATGNLGLSGALTVGSPSTGIDGFAWNGDIAEILIYNRALSDLEMTQVENYLAAKYISNLPQIIFDGDSLTSGIGSTGGQTYPQQTVDLLGGSSVYSSTNLGVPGQTLADMSSDATAQVDSLYAPYRSGNILVAWGGTNDLYFGASAATTYSRLVSYATARRNAGFKVIVATILPRKASGGTPPTFEADRQTVNTSIRNNWQTFSDGLADFAADNRIGDAGDELNVTYYDDQIHLTNVGYAIPASIVATQINILTDTTPPTVSVTAPINSATVSGSSVSLTANASDSASGVAGVQFKLDGSTNIGAEDATSTYGVTWDSTAVADGPHTITAVARDAAGNSTTSTAINITVDNTAPVISNGSPSGTASVTNGNITLSVATNENATCKYGTTPSTAYGSIANTFTGSSTTHSATISNLTAGQSYTYYVRCQDTVGNANNTDYSISFTIQSNGGGGLPTGAYNPPVAPANGYKLSINNDASTTSSQNVILTFNAGSDITNMSISNDPNFIGAIQEPYSQTKTWDLCAGASSCSLGIKTVYAKVYTSYGQPSAVFSDTINLTQSGQVVAPSPTTPQSSSYPTNTLVLDQGTIYFMTQSSKIPFSSMKVFTGLGYSLKNVIKGNTAPQPLSNYILSSATQAHPFGSWILSGKLVYYVTDSGLIPIPTWDIFLSNGGLTKYLVKANKTDLAKTILDVMQMSDARVTY